MKERLLRSFRCHHGFLCRIAQVTLFSATVFAGAVHGDERPMGKGAALYAQLKAFTLGFRSVRVENLVLKKDRVTLTFRDGMFYFPAPVEGRVRGAVFLGTGSLQAAVPPNEFERDNLRRLLKADEVASDFKTAVLRFTDDTYSVLGEGSKQGSAPPPVATKLAAELDARVLKETGANLSARQMVSILNQESPGFFFAEVNECNGDITPNMPSPARIMQPNKLAGKHQRLAVKLDARTLLCLVLAFGGLL